MESLSERDHAIKTLPIGGPGDARQLSLLMSKSPSTGDEDPQETRVVFVHWLPLKRLVGKVVPVDSETGLISYVPNFVKRKLSKETLQRSFIQLQAFTCENQRMTVKKFQLSFFD